MLAYSRSLSNIRCGIESIISIVNKKQQENYQLIFELYKSYREVLKQQVILELQREQEIKAAHLAKMQEEQKNK